MICGSSMLFWVEGSRNNVNMLKGEAPNENIMVNGHEYNEGYYLVDGIYLSVVHVRITAGWSGCVVAYPMGRSIRPPVHQKPRKNAGAARLADLE